LTHIEEGWPDAHSNGGIRESRDFYFFLDAVRLIRRSSALSAGEYDAMRVWSSKFLEWLTSSAKGNRAARRRDIHGIDYDLQTASLAAFVGDLDHFLECMRNAQLRIGHQFDPDGAQVHLLASSASFKSSVEILQSWTNVCRIAATGGTDLVSYRSRDGRSLCRAFEHLLTHIEEGWPSGSERRPGAPQSAVLWHHAHQLCPDLGKHSEPLPCRFDIASTHNWNSGIRPFWQLGF
ncbi:alginate lyase family protein, partial [Pseudomonadota bacterium]